MNLEKGQVLSETQYYVVKDIGPGDVLLTNDRGTDIAVSKGYADNCLQSAHEFSSEEKVTKTKLAGIFLKNVKTAMTVCFLKKVDEEAVIKEVMSKVEGSTIKGMESAVRSGIQQAILGKERVMVGRHYGDMNELGRVHFIDMEAERDMSKDYDTRMRQVDPRTIQWLIVDNMKYILQ